MKALTVWLLLAQGIGPSSSAITTVHKYANEQTCKADGERMRAVFWVKYLCLEVSTAEVASN